MFLIESLGDGLTLMSLIFIILTALYYSSEGQYKKASSLVISIGILFTFIGVLKGLHDFDSTNSSTIEQSIPELLSGLSTAFASSVLGMFASLVIRVIDRSQNSPSDVPKLLYGINSGLEQLNSTNSDNSEHLKRLYDSNNSNFADLKSSNDSNFADLKRSLENFLEDVSKSNSEELVKILEDVIKDFNAKINEQFGENFKHLNEGVGKMLEWQENYKNQIEASTEAITKAMESLQASESALSSIKAKQAELLNISEYHTKLLEQMEQKIKLSRETLQALSELKQAASESLPTISGELKTYTENVKTVFDINEKNAKEINKRQEETFDKINTEISGMLEKVNESNRKVVTEFMNEATKQTEQQIERLDDALQQELEKSLKSLGSQLVSLSNKFVEDYTPLTNKLREVVRLSENISQQQN